MQQSKAISLTQSIPFRLVASVLCVALAIATSSVFHIGNLPGNMFLPMHIPIIVCGFVCGHKYGGVAGFITPFVSHFITGRPIASPVPVVYFMAFELAAYGFFTGLFYLLFFKNRKKTSDGIIAESQHDETMPRTERISHVKILIVEIVLIVGALVFSLILGRIAFGLARLPVVGMGGFGLTGFMRDMFWVSLPGIIIQIVTIPILIQCLRKGKVIK